MRLGRRTRPTRPRTLHYAYAHFLLSVAVTWTRHVAGFAFVYMLDERDAEDAIRGLDNTELGRRKLVVEWTKGDGRRARERA